MKQITQKNNFVYLFFSLLIFLFSAAIMSEFPGTVGQDIFSIVTVLMILLSIRSLKTERTWMWAVYVLVIVFIILTVLGKIFDHKISFHWHGRLIFVESHRSALLSTKKPALM